MGVFRMYLMFGFNYVDGGAWNDGGIKAVHRFIDRVERLISRIIEMDARGEPPRSRYGARWPSPSEPGERVAVIEAMKMENVLFAAADGVVGKVLAARGESLAVDQPIIEFA